MNINSLIAQLEAGQDLSRETMRDVVQWMLSGAAAQPEMQQFLEAMALKTECVEELVGAAEAMRSVMQRIESKRNPVLDTCGTGGDGSKTFNISTAAALVVAGAGVTVAKHGNRKVTSSTGSADVLGELGVNLEAPPEVAQRCLNEIGICFCFAPYFHPAMKHVGPVRRQISSPTIFNRLGPLSNPAMAGHQVLGVGDAALQPKLAAALQQLGTQRSLVVRGEDGVDELSISTSTRVLEVAPGGITEHRWSPADFGLAPANRRALFADDPASSAACIRSVIDGEKGACRDVVVLNAAAALWLAGIDASLDACARAAEAAIDDSRVATCLERLASLTSQGLGEQA